MAKTASTPSDQTKGTTATKTSSRRRSAASAAPVVAEKPATTKRRRTDSGPVLTSENVVAMTTGRSTRRASTAAAAAAPKNTPAAKKSPAKTSSAKKSPAATKPAESPSRAKTKSKSPASASRKSPAKSPRSPSSEDMPPPPPRLNPHPIADETDEDEDATVPIPSMMHAQSPGRGLDARAIAAELASPLQEIQGGVRVRPGDLDADLVNSYESVNLVRSDLIREFEARGEKLVALQRDNEAVAKSLADAEEAKARAEAECARWKAAKDEMERQRKVYVEEKAATSAAHDSALESAAVRAAELEAELAGANSRCAALESERAEREATAKAAEASAMESYAASGAKDAGKAAELLRRIAELEAEAAESDANLREAKLANATAESVKVELEQRLAQSEKAFGEMEAMVADAERTVSEERAAAAQARAEAASMGGAAAGVGARVQELELSLSAMRDAAKRDAELVKKAKGLEARASASTAAEERAASAEARAARAETRAKEMEAAATSDRAVVTEREQWKAAIARVPGCTAASDLADRVVRLERELAEAVGHDGEVAAQAAAATTSLIAERRRAGEAESERDIARSKLADASAAAARATARVELLNREKDSLNRVIKSYETESANKTPSATPAAPDLRLRELEQSLNAAHVRVGDLEGELRSVTAAASGERDATSQAQQVVHELRTEVDELRRANESAAKEIAALEARVGRGEYNPTTTKIFHFKENPAAIANEAKAEKELAVVRAECEALRETVARMVAEHEQQQQMHMAMVGGLTPGSEHLMPPPMTPGMPPPLVPPPNIMATPAPTMFNRAMGTMQTPGPSVAEAELTVLKRRVAELEKREQRYMTVFKQKISTFREACYLIFGFKVDMGEDRGTGQPTFTLRSMYATKDDESMVFRVKPPKVGATGNETGGTVELLPTPYTSTDELRRMIDMYVGKWSSVPGFVANLTIELFNKQTAA